MSVCVGLHQPDMVYEHHTLCVCVCVCLLSCIQLCATPRTVTHQAPLSMGFPRQQHWSGLPFPLSGDLPDSGIEPRSPAMAGGFLTTEPDPGSFTLAERTFEMGSWLSRASHVTLSEECPV